jgi:hypothetical protein
MGYNVVRRSPGLEVHSERGNLINAGHLFHQGQKAPDHAAPDAKKRSPLNVRLNTEYGYGVII